MKIRKNLISVSIILFTLFLSGCGAMKTKLEHNDLQVSSQQSKTIFLDPVPKSQKTVYVSVKNTSDKDISIEKHLKAGIESHGYKVVNNPGKAHYLLQANILQVGKMTVAESKEVLGHGYGSVISGVGAAATVGMLGGSGDAMLGAGLIGGLLETAASSLVKDINYSMVTDVQVSERVKQKVSEEKKASLQNGLSSKTVQTTNSSTNFQRYRTRVVSNADKVNLNFAEAKPELERGLIKVLAGIF